MSILLDMHLTHVRAAGFSPRTVTARDHVLGAADLALPYGIDEATTQELAAWLARPSWGAWTRCTYYGHLTGFYRWATTGGYLDFNPAAGLTRPKQPESLPKPCTDEQLHEALRRSDNKWQMIISLAAYAGLRASEISHLRREHVDREHLVVVGKGNKIKTLPTHPEIWRLVEPRPPGLLVTTITGGILSLPPRAVDHFAAIGMPELHLHRFRHWYATKMLRQGTDIRTVQSLMRHSSLQTTAGYLEIVDAGRASAVDRLPTFIEPPDDTDQLAA